MSECVVRHDNYSCRMRYCKFFLRDLLRRVAEHLRVLEGDIREQDDRRVDDVRRIEPPSEPGLHDCRVHSLLGELGQRGRRQRPRTGSLLPLPRAREPSRRPVRSSPDHNPAARASPRRGATCRRLPADPRRAATQRSSGSRSTCRSSRPRGSTGRHAADRRAPTSSARMRSSRTPRPRVERGDPVGGRRRSSRGGHRAHHGSASSFSRSASTTSGGALT